MADEITELRAKLERVTKALAKLKKERTIELVLARQDGFVEGFKAQSDGLPMWALRS